MSQVRFLEDPLVFLLHDFLLWRGSCSGRGFSFYQHIVDNVEISTKYWNGGEPDGINAKTKTICG